MREENIDKNVWNLRVHISRWFFRERWITSHVTCQVRSHCQYRARGYSRNSEHPLPKSLYARSYFLASRILYFSSRTADIRGGVLSHDGYNRPASITKSSYSYGNVLSQHFDIDSTYVRIQHVCTCMCVCSRNARRCINHASKSIIERDAHETMRTRYTITVKEQSIDLQCIALSRY